MRKNYVITENQLASLVTTGFLDSIMGNEKPASDFQKKLLDMFIDKKDSESKKSSGSDNKKVDTSQKKSSSKVSQSGMINKDFYENLLRRLGAPITDENLKFLYAWRQAEGDGGKYNPFNTTLKKPGSTFFNYLNSQKTIGVQNYPNEEVGITATIDTLNHNRYKCITDGLKQDIGATEITNKCASALKTWGTGDLIGKVLAGYDRGASIKVKDLA